MARCQLIADNGAIALIAPYDPGLVNELKFVIPSTDRRWDPGNKRWMVNSKHGKALQDMCMKYFAELPLIPDIANSKTAPKQKILDIRYIGTTKERGTDDRSAFGWTGGGWNVLFPENVLRAWFDAPQNPDEAATLYSVLGVKRDATDEEVKAGWKRMVMQWHPDRCKEPNAQEQFMTVQHAYEVLKSNRERYDAGLMFEMSLKQSSPDMGTSRFADGYRAPLRCGLIMVEGVESLGVFIVSKIFAWEDVRDSFGRVLVVSWPKGADKFEEVWA